MYHRNLASDKAHLSLAGESWTIVSTVYLPGRDGEWPLSPDGLPNSSAVIPRAKSYIRAELFLPSGERGRESASPL